MLDRLLKLTSLLGTFLVFNGVLYLSIYYQSFGIKIFSYLDFTEVITAFLDSIKMILSFFSIYVLHLFLAVIFLAKTSARTDNSISDVEKENRHKRFLKNMNYGSILQVTLTIVLIILLFIGCLKINEWLIYIFCFVAINIIQFLVDKIIDADKVDKRYSTIFFSILLFVLPFTVYTIAFAKYDSYMTARNQQTVTIIQNDNSILNSNGYDKFIGKTNKYIFLYNINTKKSVSVSLANIKSIEYN